MYTEEIDLADAGRALEALRAVADSQGVVYGQTREIVMIALHCAQKRAQNLVRLLGRLEFRRMVVVHGIPANQIDLETSFLEVCNGHTLQQLLQQPPGQIHKAPLPE